MHQIRRMQFLVKIKTLIYAFLIFLSAFLLIRLDVGLGSAIFIVFAAVLAVVTINIQNQSAEITRISAIYDPDEKIAAIYNFMSKYIPQFASIKCSLYCMLSLAYSAKADYVTALEIVSAARCLFPYLNNNESNSGTMSATDLVILSEFYALNFLGRVEEAEKAAGPLLKKTYSSPMNKCMVGILNAELALSHGEPAAAKEIIASLRNDLEQICRDAGTSAPMLDAIIIEAIADGLENKNDDAIEKLEYVINNSKNYGDVRRAKEEFERILQK